MGRQEMKKEQQERDGKGGRELQRTINEECMHEKLHNDIYDFVWYLKTID